MRRVTGGAVQFLTRRVIFAGENYSVWKAYRDLLKHKKENGNRKFLLEKNSTARRRRKTTRGRPNETRANDNRFHVFFGSAARAKHRAERSRTRIIFIFFYPVLAGSSARRSPVPNTISRARSFYRTSSKRGFRRRNTDLSKTTVCGWKRRGTETTEKTTVISSEFVERTNERKSCIQ